ncbi:hypothetical protein GWK47_011216 [Chionoecetes opilio]|uniref:Uncharacterized protein n=1 Tax=Chionoecetes opilio TaxID=41210 RepID=A0A8J5C2T2_CHIOP|nr:hypothetical protein GWK47_011216 [Chionoecetes opilio]
MVVSPVPRCRAPQWGKGGLRFWGRSSPTPGSRQGFLSRGGPRAKVCGHIKHIAKKAPHRGFAPGGGQLPDRGGNSCSTKGPDTALLKLSRPLLVSWQPRTSGWTVPASSPALVDWSDPPTPPDRPPSSSRESLLTHWEKPPGVRGVCGIFQKAQVQGGHTGG